MTIDVIIPTYQPGEKFKRLVEMLEKQTLPVNKIIVINTEEKYMEAFHIGSRFLAEHKKLSIHHISQKEFDHGRSRNLGARKSEADILVYMTQDAVPYNEYLLEELVKPLQDERVACAYARQLASDTDTMVEKLTREFNYPAKDQRKSKADLNTLGIKTYFCSNVCCAYNAAVFKELGGFVKHAIFNEDMLYAAKAMENGYQVVYAANAKVLHSHNYTGKQQFHRNFDLGVSQAQHPEVFAGISSESEGIRMIKQTIRQLIKRRTAAEVPGYIVTSGCKFIGYRLGKQYQHLPMWLVKKCSMSPEFFR